MKTDCSQSLNAFISAWAGLEILIGATFEQYEASWTAAISGALPPSAQNVAGRMRTFMKENIAWRTSSR